MGPYYCHPCLTEMGLERHGGRYRDPVLASIDADCACCKKPGSLFSIRDYQRQRHAKKRKMPTRKPLYKKLKPIGEWPAGVRFDEAER